jgi:LacI family transcriptional regulator
MEAQHQPKIRRVAVLVDTSTTWGRDVISGVHRYGSGEGNWQLFLEPRGIEQRRWLPSGWKGDGVVARIGLPGLAKQLRAMRIPVVNVSAIRLPQVDHPRVVADQEASANLAAEHLLDRGYRHFGYFSLLGLEYVMDHQLAFQAALRMAGHDCAVYTVQPEIGAEPNWNLDLKRLGQWLRRLPKPLAVFAWNSSSAREVVYACVAAGLSIPEEVAVLSGTEDDLLCKVAPVPISAVSQNAEMIGFRAAAELDQLMSRPLSRMPAEVRIAPSGVVVRRSTEHLAIEDPSLVKALQFIRARFANPIQVEDVARHAGVSRRALEQRFREQLKRTPAAEIRRVRVEHAAGLMRQTSLPVSLVAEKCGFSSPEYMAVTFRRQTGMTPMEMRAGE